MSATKGSSTLQATATSASGATTNSSSINLTTYYGAYITAQVTNGATAPTTPCTVTIQVGPDGTTWFDAVAGSSGLTNSAVYPFSFEIPIGVMYARVKFSGHTAQSVTVAAQCTYVSAI